MHRKKLAALIACAAMLAAAFPGTAKAGTAHHRHYLHRTFHRPITPYWRPGTTAGWRYRNNYGWDNTCFNLPWLPSEFACSSHGP